MALYLVVCGEGPWTPRPHTGSTTWRACSSDRASGWERESRALAEALEEHPSATPLVVSRLESEPLHLGDSRQAPVRPAWRFALELPEPVRRMTMADLAPPPPREPDRGR